MLVNRLVESIENSLFSAADTVCLERARLVTEAWAKHEAEPAPLLRARVFEHVLKRMPLDLCSNPVFAGNTSATPRAWMLTPEFAFSVDSQIALENSELQGFLEGKIPEDIRSFWEARNSDKAWRGGAGIGHMSLDFDSLVNRGLNDVLARIEEHQRAGSPEQRQFRQAMGIACRAVVSWAERCASAAGVAAADCSDPVEASCLRRVADACRHVPAHPARNLFEGLQAIALVHLASVLEGQGLSVSIGLPDRALARFVPEVEDAPEDAVLLVRAFLLKVAANSFQGRGSKTQAITVGGATGDGDACNAVTLAFLDAVAETPVSDPHLFLRWHEGIDGIAWQKGLDMLSAGRSMPLLVNDHQVVPGLLAAGVALEDAWDYCVVGCNELGIPGRCCQSGFPTGMSINDLEVVDAVVRAPDCGQATTADVLDRYEAAVYEAGARGPAARRKALDAYVAERPFPFCSACCRSCVESGRDLIHGMPYPDIYGLFTRGTSNAANVLAVIEHLTGREGGHRLGDLLSRVDDRDPDTLEAIAEAPKWGNDDDTVDRLGVELNARRDRALRRAAEEAGLPPFAVCHVVRSLHHLDGRRIGATLDGREGGSPVGDSIGAVLGTQTEGPTAMLNSVLKLDAAKCFTGIYNLNLTLPAGPQADAGVICHLAEAFFLDGGQELQVNVLDAAKLRRAQKDPDSYRDLVVRVAGLNARFVELSLVEQEELIRRAEAVSGTSESSFSSATRPSK